jgi:DNA primase
MRATPHPTISNAVLLRVAAIHQAVSIFDVFERMGLSLRPETQQIRCPFHPDHSPSARVYADQNVLYCFTEQKRWDVIACVQDHFHLTFLDAMGWLEREFGVGLGPLTLPATIRLALSHRPRPAVAEAATTLEQQLKARRDALGFERYTQALLALDLLVYDAATLTTADIQRRLDALQQAVRAW